MYTIGIRQNDHSHPVFDVLEFCRFVKFQTPISAQLDILLHCRFTHMHASYDILSLSHSYCKCDTLYRKIGEEVLNPPPLSDLNFYQRCHGFYFAHRSYQSKRVLWSNFVAHSLMY